MDILPAWYSVGVALFTFIAALVPADDSPVLTRAAAVLGIGVLWPLVLIAVAEWLLIRTVALICAGRTRPSATVAGTPILAGRH